ncbi:MAG: cytochrome c-type biogenesis CcmF C-terminal domain-containing protein, partial [Aestuariivirga sp.]|nr:cytochrome c-type biogenesis CcmF C-terminal domain-containing protein [Aestuariivirga sp.]
GALTLFAWRAPALKAGGFFSPISREGGLVLNNLFLCAACASVLIGTLYPLALETVTGEKISVGPPYFNLTFGPIMLPLLLLVPIGALLSWKRADLFAVLQRLWAAAALAIGLGVLVLVATQRGPWLAPLGMALGAWLILGSLADLANRIALFRSPLATSLSRLVGLPRSSIGMTSAHAGLGLMIIGIIAITLWKVEHIVAMKPGERADVGDYSVQFVGETPLTGENYTGRAGKFRIFRGQTEIATVVSEKREFKPMGTPTTEVGLHQTLAGDVYVVMGDKAADGARVVRMYFNPLVSLIWLGALIMFFGGAMSLTDRRYRVGAPNRKLTPAGVPAE